MKHKGSCHCGKVRFDVEGDFDSAIECNCSHCSRKGLLLSFVPRSQLTWEDEAGALTTYTFNTHRIKHQFCSNCGCAPFSFGSQDGVETAAINLRCLEDIDLSTVERKFVDGRSF